MWMPKWFYELLPVIYAGGGAGCLAWLGYRGPGALSASLLFAAAVLTAGWRRNHRARRGRSELRTAAARAARPRHVAALRAQAMC